MGGTIDVESVVNEGTIFRVSLRLELDRRPKPKAVESASLERVRVLVVDNETNRKILRDQLTAWGAGARRVVAGRKWTRSSDNGSCLSVQYHIHGLPYAGHGRIGGNRCSAYVRKS